MKKKLKTYAVAGMMEYQTIVKVGRNSVKVNFTGGSISNGCAQPARFSSKNLIIQNAIEASDEFTRGRIRLEKAIPLNEEIRVEKPVEPSVLSLEPSDGSAAAEESPQAGPAENKPAEMQGATGEWREECGEERAESEEETGSLTEVEVACKDVAKQYLQDHYGERPAPLRTWADVQACAAKHGITFISPTLE